MLILKLYLNIYIKHIISIFFEIQFFRTDFGSHVWYVSGPTIQQECGLGNGLQDT